MSQEYLSVLRRRQKELKSQQSELIAVIQTINDQLRLKPLTKENRDWVAKARDAKRWRLRDLDKVQLELVEIREQLRENHQSKAEAFFRAAKEYLPDEVFGRIMQAATTTFS